MCKLFSLGLRGTSLETHTGQGCPAIPAGLVHRGLMEACPYADEYPAKMVGFRRQSCAYRLTFDGPYLFWE